jgi:hypothetical protein
MLKTLCIIVKKIDTTSKTKPTICIFSINEGKTQNKVGYYNRVENMKIC